MYQNATFESTGPVPRDDGAICQDPWHRQRKRGTPRQRARARTPSIARDKLAALRVTACQLAYGSGKARAAETKQICVTDHPATLPAADLPVPAAKRFLWLEAGRDHSGRATAIPRPRCAHSATAGEAELLEGGNHVEAALLDRPLGSVDWRQRRRNADRTCPASPADVDRLSP